MAKTGTLRVPPNSLEAEFVALGACIRSPQAMAAVLDMLDLDDFYRPAHGLIFQALAEMAEAREPVDLITLQAHLTTTKQLATVGGIDYLLQLVNDTPGAANARHYAEIVRDKSLKRQLIRFGEKIAADAYEDEEDAAAILLAGQTELCRLDAEARAIVGKEESLGKALAGVMREVEERYQSPGTAVPRCLTGYRLLDKAIHGLRPGHLITLAGATSHGKTSLALNIAANVAAAGGPVVYVSAEMLPPELAQRCLQAASSVNANRIVEARLEQSEWNRLSETEAELSPWPFYLIGRPLSVGAIASKANAAALRYQKPLALIVVDYLQIMELPKAQSLRERISEMTGSLKRLAMDLAVPVLMLSQFAREESKKKQPPSIYGLKESGSIENDSNEVLLLYRPEPQRVAMNTDGRISVEVWLRVAKCRDGMETQWPEGKSDEKDCIKLRWHPQWTRFDPW